MRRSLSGIDFAPPSTALSDWDGHEDRDCGWQWTTFVLMAELCKKKLEGKWKKSMPLSRAASARRPKTNWILMDTPQPSWHYGRSPHAHIMGGSCPSWGCDKWQHNQIADGLQTIWYFHNSSYQSSSGAGLIDMLHIVSGRTNQKKINTHKFYVHELSVLCVLAVLCVCVPLSGWLQQ